LLADVAGDTVAGVSQDLFSDTHSIADSDISSIRSTDSRFTRSTGFVFDH